jgi:transcriptional regulator with XRE-family HTH domain
MKMKRLKELRLQRGLSQRELAKQSRIHRTAIAKFEKGERSPRAASLIRLADTLQVSIDYLIDLSDDPTPYRRREDAD